MKVLLFLLVVFSGYPSAHSADWVTFLHRNHLDQIHEHCGKPGDCELKFEVTFNGNMVSGTFQDFVVGGSSEGYAFTVDPNSYQGDVLTLPEGVDLSMVQDVATECVQHYSDSPSTLCQSAMDNLKNVDLVELKFRKH